MTARFWGEGRTELDKVVEDERAAVYQLFRRESAKSWEDVCVYVNPEDSAPYNFGGRFAQITAEKGHVTGVSLYHCVQRSGFFPEELKRFPHLKRLSFCKTPSFIFEADPTYLRELERLQITKGPIVVIDPVGMNLSLKELVVRESELRLPRGLHGFPNLQKADFAYSGLEKAPGLCEARSLEYLDLSQNRIASYEGLKNPGSLKRVDLRGNGFWRRLGNYRKNRGVVRELREKGVEVAE